MALHVGIDARLISGQLAGIGHYTYLLYKYLRESGQHKITLYDDDYFTGGGDFSRLRGRGLRKILYILWLNTRFPAQLKRDEVDLIHAPNFIPPLWGKPPSVATFMDLGFLRYPHTHHSLYAAAFPSLVNRAVDKARLIAVPSKSTRDEIIHFYPRARNKIRVVYLAAEEAFKVLNDSALLDSVRAKHKLPERFILCVGTMEPRKNLERFFNAFGMYLGRNPGSELRLVLCGKSWVRHGRFLEALRASGIGERVIIAGYVAQDELAAIYNCALALAFPTFYEGFGIPAVEAMQCGLPVISSEAFSLPEVLGGAAIYFNPFDPEAMASAIEKITESDEERTRLREAGLERAKMFSWEKTAKEMEDVYTEALA
ncbi:MAG: glycosyltransferase family 4 protein [candidate division Zixibacteria bacterium]|nr:glycosyltransferase family 4 protein [Candidatus Tariuqbacter arcticus]